jgi:hypothetical protein
MSEIITYDDMGKLIDMLSKETVSADEAYRYGSDLATEVRLAFGGTYNQPRFEYLLSVLSPVAAKRLRIIATVILLELAHDWRASGFDHWDERKQASMRFAYAHEGLLKQQFKSLVGFELPSLTDDAHKTYYLPSAISRLPFKQNDCEWIYYFILPWGNMHSTVKQSICKGWFRAVLKPENPNIDFGEVWFPVI